MHRKSILIEIQLVVTVCSLIYFTAKLLYMFRVSQHPLSEVLKTVTAASSTGHNIGTAISLQRGKVGTGLGPNLATLEPYVTTYPQLINTYHTIRTNQSRSCHVGGK